MQDTPWSRVAEIFSGALELEGGAREAYLSAHCADDLELRLELDSLLAAALRAGPFLSDSPVGAPSPVSHLPPEVALGTRIGAYTLLRPIAAGGMGAVFEARQDHPERIVALKLASAPLLLPSARARLRAEARILGRLQHPGIAQIFEAGEDASGRPYFAMQLIEGAESVTDFARARGFGWHEMVLLFLQACDAVHYGHEQGVVHRDLKPSNILVDSRGRARLIDFGIAHLTDPDAEARLTRTGDVFGTLQYMSPEQLDAKPTDARTDVYALGAVLFELVCGRPPHLVHGLTLVGAATLIREEAAPRARVLAPALPIELEWILAKALEHEPERRYASAAALGADLRRLLAFEPVVASAPSRIYRTRKFVRRHRAIVLGTLGVVLALAIGLVLALAQARRALRAEASAGARLADAQRESRTKDAVIQFQKDWLRSPDPELGGAEARVVDLLEQAGESLESSFEREPRIEAELRRSLGDAYYNLGLDREALAQVELAWSGWYAALTPDDPERIATSYERLRSQSRLGLGSETEQAARELHARVVRVLGEEHELARQAMQVWIDAQLSQGHVAEAETQCRALLEATELALGRDARPVSELRIQLAKSLRQVGRFDEAIALCREARESALRTLGEEHTTTLAAMTSLAIALRSRGNLDEAESLQRRVLELRTRKRGEASVVTLQSAQALAIVLRQLGRFDESETLLRDTLATGRRAHGDEHVVVLAVEKSLGQLLIKRARFAEARSVLEHTLETHRRLHGSQHPETVSTLIALASAHRNLGSPQAEPLVREALSNAEAVHGPEHPMTLLASNNLATVLMAQNRHREAAELLNATLDIQVRVLGYDHDDCATSMQNLGLVLRRLGEMEASEGMQRAALDQRLRTRGFSDLDATTAMGNLGAFLAEMGRHTEARQLLESGLALKRILLGDEHPKTALAARELGEALMAARQPTEALPRLDYAYAIACCALDEDSGTFIEYEFHYASCLSELGRTAEAMPILERNLEHCLARSGQRGERTRRVRERLIELHEKLGSSARADALRADLR